MHADPLFRCRLTPALALEALALAASARADVRVIVSTDGQNVVGNDSLSAGTGNGPSPLAPLARLAPAERTEQARYW